MLARRDRPGPIFGKIRGKVIEIDNKHRQPRRLLLIHEQNAAMGETWITGSQHYATLNSQSVNI